jgi:hypothetical protein
VDAFRETATRAGTDRPQPLHVRARATCAREAGSGHDVAPMDGEGSARPRRNRCRGAHGGDVVRAGVGPYLPAVTICRVCGWSSMLWPRRGGAARLAPFCGPRRPRRARCCGAAIRQSLCAARRLAPGAPGQLVPCAVLLDRDADKLCSRPLDPLVHLHRLTSTPGRGLACPPGTCLPVTATGIDIGSAKRVAVSPRALPVVWHLAG